MDTSVQEERTREFQYARDVLLYILKPPPFFFFISRYPLHNSQILLDK